MGKSTLLDRGKSCDSEGLSPWRGQTAQAAPIILVIGGSHNLIRQPLHTVNTPTVTVDTVLRSLFREGKLWSNLAIWPPDIFGAAGYILNLTGAYRRAICNDWWKTVITRHPANLLSVGKTWRLHAAKSLPPPVEVQKAWQNVRTLSKVKLSRIEEKRELVNHLLNLVAMADVACEGFGLPHPNYSEGETEFHLLEMADKLLARGPLLAQASTLGRNLKPDILCVLPKIHTPQVGLTFRSLSHNLALCVTDEVRPIWNGINTTQGRRDHKRFNLLLVPTPDTITGTQFREVDHNRSGRHRMPRQYRSFTFQPDDQSEWLKTKFVELVQAAKSKTSDKFIHGVLFPELSFASRAEFALAYSIVQKICPGAFLIGGVAESGSNGTALPRNCAYFGIPQILAGEGVAPLDILCTQAKHHKWRITPAQVADYGLEASLDDTKMWWENIKVEPRCLNFFALKQTLTLTFVICEDLARQEPASRLLRAIGPNLVVAILMDNEQVSNRWPARYATVLAEDPGCSVLTLTCRGMAALGAERFHKRPRSKHVIALWRDGSTTHEIAIKSTSLGAVLSLCHEETTEYSVDGRSAATVNLVLRDPSKDVLEIKPKKSVLPKAKAHA